MPRWVETTRFQWQIHNLRPSGQTATRVGRVFTQMATQGGKGYQLHLLPRSPLASLAGIGHLDIFLIWLRVLLEPKMNSKSREGSFYQHVKCFAPLESHLSEKHKTLWADTKLQFCIEFCIPSHIGDSSDCPWVGKRAPGNDEAVRVRSDLFLSSRISRMVPL